MPWTPDQQHSAASFLLIVELWLSGCCCAHAGVEHVIINADIHKRDVQRTTIKNRRQTQ
jgi:hypothetical protein